MFDRDAVFEAMRKDDPHGRRSDGDIGAEVDRLELLHDIDDLPDHSPAWAAIKDILRRLAER